MEEVSALKIRVKFTKHGALKFIGHLDIMRYFSTDNYVDVEQIQGL